MLYVILFVGKESVVASVFFSCYELAYSKSGVLASCQFLARWCTPMGFQSSPRGDDATDLLVPCHLLVGLLWQSQESVKSPVMSSCGRVQCLSLSYILYAGKFSEMSAKFICTIQPNNNKKKEILHLDNFLYLYILLQRISKQSKIPVIRLAFQLILFL